MTPPPCCSSWSHHVCLTRSMDIEPFLPQRSSVLVDRARFGSPRYLGRIASATGSMGTLKAFIYRSDQSSRSASHVAVATSHPSHRKTATYPLQNPDFLPLIWLSFLPC